MAKRPVTTDISGQLILMGCGTSVGVPAIGCGCEVCTSDHPRNNRTRCSVAIGLPAGNLLIDTPPDLRIQLLQQGLGVVHSVLFTHSHADHLFGLDDLRLFSFYLGGPVPLFCEENVQRRIRHSFDYAFQTREETHPGAAPKLKFETISTEPFDVLGATIIPIRMQHGPRFEVLGFRIGNVAYCTDTNHIPASSLALLEGLDVFIVDALRHKSHATHFSLDEAIEVSRQLKPKRTVFTHLSHAFDYEKTNAELPETMELAYDGMRIPLS